MKQRLALFPAHLSICIAEDETNSGEEVGLSGTIATDDDIALGREGLDDCLLLVTLRLSGILTGTFLASMAYLLKPWMIICLICILAVRGAL